METSLAEKAYTHIRSKLADGEFAPGKQLVNRALADEIGVSVIPVREAINRLTSEGLVEHVPGAGAFVRKVDREQLNNLYVLRDALESCAAGEAARNITPYQLEELESLLEEAREISRQVASNAKKFATKRQMNLWLDNEQRFHELLVESAQNPLLARVVHEHRAIGQVFDAQRDDPRLLPAEVAEYTCGGRSDLIEALRARDHARARQLTSEQIQRGRKQVLDHLRSKG